MFFKINNLVHAQSLHFISVLLWICSVFLLVSLFCCFYAFSSSSIREMWKHIFGCIVIRRDVILWVERVLLLCCDSPTELDPWYRPWYPLLFTHVWGRQKLRRILHEGGRKAEDFLLSSSACSSAKRRSAVAPWKSSGCHWNVQHNIQKNKWANLEKGSNTPSLPRRA